MRKNLTGQKFGKLTALNPTEKRKRGVVIWDCVCDCGNKIEVTTTDLTCGRKNHVDAQKKKIKNLLDKELNSLILKIELD